MKTFRLIGNIVVALILAVILAGLVINIAVDRCSRAESAANPKASVQEVPFR